MARIEAAAALRTLIARGDFVTAPGAYDPYSARLIEKLGFPAVYLGGNALGLHTGKGQPFISVSETADIVARVGNEVTKPIIVDAGAGFGDASHCYRAVRDLEYAGAAAIHIDDQPYPKQALYHLGKGSLAPVDVVTDKLKAALDARRNADVMIIARTDALRVTKSADAVIDRARAYIEAGVDGLMVLDLGPDNASHVRSAVARTPLVWIGGIVPPVPTTTSLHSAGFGVAVYPFNVVAAITEAMMKVWQPLRADGVPGATSRSSKELLDQAFDTIGLEHYWNMELRAAERKEKPAPGKSDR
jgi:2-methylisocitrate lyase-like PEP mutase family enzyme